MKNAIALVPAFVFASTLAVSFAYASTVDGVADQQKRSGDKAAMQAMKLAQQKLSTPTPSANNRRAANGQSKTPPPPSRDYSNQAAVNGKSKTPPPPPRDRSNQAAVNGKSKILPLPVLRTNQAAAGGGIKKR